MLINKSNLSQIYRNLNAAFQMAFEAAPKQWDKIAMRIGSTSSRNDYSWVQYFPKMREWIGDKVVKALAGQNYVIPNKDFEATIEVDRNDIEDDQLGIYLPQVQMAGYSAMQLPDEIVFDLLNKGFVNKCYDGKPFFASDHPVGELEVSNMFAKRLDISTFDKARASFGAAWVALRNMKDDEGRPLNIMPDALVVSPALEAEAEVLSMAQNFKDQEPNPYKGKFEVVSDARITSPTAWFLLDTGKPIRALIYQERKPATFVSQTDPDVDSVFMRKKFRFSAECRAAGGYGFWQLAYGSTGTED